MAKIKNLFMILCLTINSISGVTKITPEKHIDMDDDRSILIQMANGFLLSRALTTAAQLGIADYLKSKAKTAGKLAVKLGVTENNLYRLMRMLAAHDIFKENENHEFSLTSLGELLVSDNPKTLRNFLMMDDKTRWCAYGDLKSSIKKGKTAFETTFDKSFFDYIKDKKRLQKLFDNGMQDISANENVNIAKNIKLVAPENISLVDVGGGKGGLLFELKKIYPTLAEAILFDYSSLEKKDRELLKEKDISFIRGSFFDLNDLPAKKDIYILKRVLHDWADKECIEILKNCRKAMKEDGKIIIIDTVLSSGNEYHIGKDIDIVMMALFGGQERTKEEFDKLANDAGLLIEHITPIEGTMLSLIELKTL